MLFSIPRGATKSWLVEVRVDGVLMSLVGARIYFTAKIGSTVITKVNTAAGGGDDQIEIVSEGKYRVKLTHADTANEAPRPGSCDSWVVTPGNDYIQAVDVRPFVIGPAITSPP